MIIWRGQIKWGSGKVISKTNNLLMNYSIHYQLQTNINNPYVTTEKMLNYFPKPVKCNYRKFVKEGIVLKK